MDAAGFTAIRLVAGAATLALFIVFLHQGPQGTGALFRFNPRAWLGAVLLFVYALSFSAAYLLLETGSGALILFGSVQLTMLLAGFLSGQRPGLLEWLGVLLAFSGLIYLMVPAVGTPTLLGFVLMSISGVAWGFYTWAGKGSAQPLLDTGKNFIMTVPLVLVMCLVSFQPNLWTAQGVFLAVVSGALTSGVGYAIWYAVLPELKTSQAGVVQLMVPIIAAMGGVVFAGETMTSRLIMASALVLGGVYVVMWVSRPNGNR